MSAKIHHSLQCSIRVLDSPGRVFVRGAAAPAAQPADAAS